MIARQQSVNQKRLFSLSVMVTFEADSLLCLIDTQFQHNKKQKIVITNNNLENS